MKKRLLAAVIAVMTGTMFLAGCDLLNEGKEPETTGVKQETTIVPGGEQGETAQGSNEQSTSAGEQTGEANTSGEVYEGNGNEVEPGTETSDTSVLTGSGKETILISDQYKIENLIASNLAFVKIYETGSMDIVESETVDNPDDPGSLLYLVNDERYADYLDLDGAIRAVYCNAEADRLLLDGKYVNRRGSVYLDPLKNHITEDNVDWSTYVVEFHDIEDTTCDFTVLAVESTQQGPVQHAVSGRAVVENGRWVLEKMFH